MHIRHLAVITTLLILIGHTLGTFFNLYSPAGYYDTLLHFLGGAWVASFVIYFATLHSFLSYFNPRALWNVLLTTCITLSLGVVWELFEFVLARLTNTAFVANIYTDTLTDLVADTFGAFFISFFFFILIKKQYEKVQSPHTTR